MQEHIGEHILWHLPVLGAVHADTIVTTWLVMVVALIFFGWIGASYRSPYVSKRQAVLEAVFNYIADLVTSVLGEEGEAYVPFFVALFIFIFIVVPPEWSASTRTRRPRQGNKPSSRPERRSTR